MKKYISPEISVKIFSDTEIITASTPNVPERDPDAPIELPFVPASVRCSEY